MSSRRGTALDNYLMHNQKGNSNGRYQSQKFSPQTNDSGSWETNFFRSQNQCLDELNKLLRKVNSEEGRVRQHMKDYQFSVLQRLGAQYAALKAQLIRILDGSYEKCLIKVKEGFLGNEMMEFERAIKMLQNIRQKIRSFQFQLETNYTYKKGISHVVLQNFEAQRAEIIGNMNNALRNYEGKVFLKVEPSEFAKMKEALANLFTYIGEQSNGTNIKGSFNHPKMFSIPISNTGQQNISNNSIQHPFRPNSMNQNFNQQSTLNPPFKPFPGRQLSQSPPGSNVVSFNQQNSSPSPSGIRYGPPNPQFEKIFNQQSSQKVQQANQPEQITYQQRSSRGMRPNSRQRSSSPNFNSHPNRDFIRKSSRQDR